MIENNDILQELNDMHSPLAHISRSMPYTLPQGYFDAFEEKVHINIKFIDSPDPVLNLSKEMPHHVSSGYFAAFEAQLKNTLDETTLPKTIMPFVAPAGYFENLPTQILSKLSEEAQPVRKTKTISLRAEVWRQVRWAAAAIFILGIGFGTISNFTRPQSVGPELALSKVSRAEISNYVDQHIDDFDTDMINDNLSENDINVLSKQLDANDITQYLNEHGWDHAE